MQLHTVYICTKCHPTRLDPVAKRNCFSQVKLLKQGPAKHLQQHAYEYRRKFDVELASIRRLKELQVIASRPQVHRFRYVAKDQRHQQQAACL